MSEEAKLTIRLNVNDNVIVARVEILPGTHIQDENIKTIVQIPRGHKTIYNKDRVMNSIFKIFYTLTICIIFSHFFSSSTKLFSRIFNF